MFIVSGLGCHALQLAERGDFVICQKYLKNTDDTNARQGVDHVDESAQADFESDARHSCTRKCKVVLKLEHSKASQDGLHLAEDLVVTPEDGGDQFVMLASKIALHNDNSPSCGLRMSQT